MFAIPLCFNVEVYVFTLITQQKSLKYQLYLINARRHVSAVFTAIFSPISSTVQVQILRIRTTFLPNLYYKLA